MAAGEEEVIVSQSSPGEGVGVQLLLDRIHWADWVPLLDGMQPQQLPRIYRTSGTSASRPSDEMAATVPESQAGVYLDVLEGCHLGALQGVYFIKVCYAGKAYSARSVVVTHGDNWWLLSSQRFEFFVNQPRRGPITIEVYQSAQMQPGELVGRVQLQLHSLVRGMSYSGWVPLLLTEQPTDSLARIHVRGGWCIPTADETELARLPPFGVDSELTPIPGHLTHWVDDVCRDQIKACSSGRQTLLSPTSPTKDLARRSSNESGSVMNL